jgi:hypothetical protein
MTHGFHHHPHGEDILVPVQFFENVEQTVGNILGMSDDQEYEMIFLEVSFFDKIRCKPQNVIVLVLTCTVVHHNIQNFPLGAIQQSAIVKMFHQEQCDTVSALVTILFAITV